MIEIMSASGDAVYMQNKLAEMLNGGWEILHIQTAALPSASSTRYETIAYFKRTVSNS